MKAIQNNPGSGIKVLNILLLESTFKRFIEVLFEPGNVNNDININVSHQIENNQIFVTEKISFSMAAGDNKIMEAEITMLGHFEKFGDAPLSLEDFAKVNGPAIIFPFIREQLATQTLKAGIGQIILPPINFVKLSEQK